MTNNNSSYVFPTVGLDLVYMVSFFVSCLVSFLILGGTATFNINTVYSLYCVALQHAEQRRPSIPT